MQVSSCTESAHEDTCTHSPLHATLPFSSTGTQQPLDNHLNLHLLLMPMYVFACCRGADLDLILRTCGIRNLVLTGVTTDVCVHTTLRDANDMGYECLLLSDATAATDPANHAAALSMVQKQVGQRW